jgi:hypothetical protein
VSDLFLPGLFVVVWVASWWWPRRFRLFFALLSPFGSVAAIVFAFMSVPRGLCDHGCVMGWANSLDGSPGVAGAFLTLPVTLAIFTVTAIVELVVFVRRNSSEPEPMSTWDSPEAGSLEREARKSGEDGTGDQSWSKPIHVPRRY